MRKNPFLTTIYPGKDFSFCYQINYYFYGENRIQHREDETEQCAW